MLVGLYKMEDTTHQPLERQLERLKRQLECLLLLVNTHTVSGNEIDEYTILEHVSSDADLLPLFRRLTFLTGDPEICTELLVHVWAHRDKPGHSDRLDMIRELFPELCEEDIENLSAPSGMETINPDWKALRAAYKSKKSAAQDHTHAA